MNDCPRCKKMVVAIECALAWFDPDTREEGHGAWPLVRRMQAALSPTEKPAPDGEGRKMP